MNDCDDPKCCFSPCTAKISLGPTPFNVLEDHVLVPWTIVGDEPCLAPISTTYVGEIMDALVIEVENMIE